MQYETLCRRAAEYGFTHAYACPAPADAPGGVVSLAVVLRAYTAGRPSAQGLAVDRYFPASNAAYHDAKRLSDALNAAFLPGYPLKPVLLRLAAFARGKNTLSYHRDMGSRFVVQLIGLHEAVTPHSPARAPRGNDCGACRICIDACPARAIGEDVFCRERCLRAHMLSGSETPPSLRPLMENRLLGCDVCQRVCPRNEGLALDAPLAFPPGALLPPGEAFLEEFARLAGGNYRSKNRLTAQALLCAGNSGDVSLLPAVRALCAHPSQVVRAHAVWAAAQLEQKT